MKEGLTVSRDSAWICNCFSPLSHINDTAAVHQGWLDSFDLTLSRAQSDSHNPFATFFLNRPSTRFDYFVVFCVA